MVQNRLVKTIFRNGFPHLSTYITSRWGLVSHFLARINSPLLEGILFIVCLWLLYWILRLYLSWKGLVRPTTLFEIVLPAFTRQGSFSTTQLFSSIHGLLQQRNWTDRLFKINRSCSFEIISTRERGICYLVRASVEDAKIVKKNLVAYLPGVAITDVEDYFGDNLKHRNIVDFRLSSHFAFPLKKEDNLGEYDPIAYIAGIMTKLADNELVAVQVVVSPAEGSVLRTVSRLRRIFLKNSDVLSELTERSFFGRVFRLIMCLGLEILLLPIGLMVWVFSGGGQGPIFPLSWTTKLPNSVSRASIETQIKGKIDQQLFSVSFRLLIVSPSISVRRRVENGFSAALSPFTNANYQGLLPVRSIQGILGWLYQRRLAVFGNNQVLSSSELSDLYHFPYSQTTKTENISKQLSRELPAPLSLKQRSECDLYFARNNYGGGETMIGLTLEERRRHVYILGATGTGKSTMLLNMIKHDIEQNKGLCLIDPHGDLAEQVLSTIPDERVADIIYFNPDDVGYPIGINLLELTPGLGPEDAEKEKEFITESIISIFQKIYTDKYSGPRMEYILRNTIYTAFNVPDATLFTVYKILINPAFRKSVVRTLVDENLLDFWQYEFGKAGDYQKVKMISPITNKIGRFLFSPSAKHILGQPRSTINFDAILNEGKILLCNLSKGKIGEDNSSVFGVLIMAKIQLAAIKRARIPMDKRRDFFLYVDEFQNFATPAFAQILSEARKYRLGAILAHQTTSQLEDKSLVNVTLANTGTVICFRTANPEDERMILPSFQPYISQGEIPNLPSYHFYMRLGAMKPEEPFSGETIPIRVEADQSLVDKVIESSRRIYSKRWIEPVILQAKKTIEKGEIKVNYRENDCVILPFLVKSTDKVS